MNTRYEISIIAIITLCIGVLVYVLDRQVESVYFLTEWLSLNNKPIDFFGSVGNYLPTFIHVYAFILLTVAVAAPSVINSVFACIAWFTIDSLFEVGQIDSIAQWILLHTPDWFSGIPFLENTTDYFLSGTFDVLDLVSIAIGAIAAYLTVVFILEGHRDDTSI